MCFYKIFNKYMTFHDWTCSQFPGNFCPIYWTLCIHGIKTWKIDKSTPICVSTETIYIKSSYYAVFSFIKCQVIKRKIFKFWRLFFDYAMSYESIFQHIKITWNIKLLVFSLYRSIVSGKFFLMDFSIVLWHYITIFHGISRNIGF